VGARTIYILDDDELFRESLRRLVSVRSNLLIHCYRFGEAFLEQSEELEPGVLLLDQQLSGISGTDVLHAIDPAKFPTIMLSGYASVSLATQAMRAGAVNFLEKPFDSGTLMQTIEAAFQKLEQDRAAAARVQSAKRRLDRLSEREKAVLELLIEGHSNKLIAHELDISPRTVESHRAKLMDKLEVRSLSEALRLSFAAGLVSPENASGDQPPRAEAH
jgi:two-component system response regulator FixJ